MKSVVRFLFVFLLFVNGIIVCQEAEAHSLSATDSLRIRNFVIKCHILILNTKPSKKESSALCSKFNLFQSFANNKKALIDSLMNDAAFYRSMCNLFRFEYLQGTTMEQVYEDVFAFKFLLTIKSQSDFFDQFALILDNLEKLAAAEKDLQTNKITLANAEERFFFNRFYDDINMGPDNMVISTFNYLFYRNPTKYELSEGIKIVLGQPGVLFSRSGSSKIDYLNILYDSDAYVEGRVRYWYNKLLNREPTSFEIVGYLKQKEEFEIKTLIKNIILTKEFSGG